MLSRLAHSRLLATVLLVGLAACGGDSDVVSAAPASPSATEASGPLVVRVVDNDPAVRQRLSPPEILGYFPAMLGDREPSSRSIRLSDEERESGTSHADVRYRRPPRMDATIEVAVTDHVDNPDGPGPEAETGQRIDIYGLGTVSDARTLEGGLGRSYQPDDGPPSLHILLADRFTVVLRADDPAMSVDDLWAVYNASGLERLAGADVYGAPGGPAPPEWAADPIAQWEASFVAEAPAPPPSQTASATPLASCDEILPVAEVRRVCGIPELKVDVGSFETEGTNCNRTYNRGREISGLIFLVSHYSNESLARSAQQASMNFDSQLNRRDVAGLGDAATRVVHDLDGEQKHILSVATGVDLLEFKSGDYDVEPRQQVCTLDQMETLARGVVERLAASSP